MSLQGLGKDVKRCGGMGEVSLSWGEGHSLGVCLQLVLIMRLM